MVVGLLAPVHLRAAPRRRAARSSEGFFHTTISLDVSAGHRHAGEEEPVRAFSTRKALITDFA